MNILYVCTQHPGFGGASTETYEAIKQLRRKGCGVKGLFIVEHKCFLNCCDPDGIGGIEVATWHDRDDPKLLMGNYDVVIGKNYEAAWVIRKRADLPTIYLTSGIDHVSKFSRPASTFKEVIPDSSHDVRAFRSARYVIVHSTVDLAIYRSFLPPDLFAKITGDVVYTPNIAVPILKQNQIPYEKREFDLCFSASNWKRTMKNPGLMYAACQKLKGRYRIIVFGEEFNEPGVTAAGLVPHAEMMRLLGQSRVVAIPSFYDPSPNLYPEAVYSGCNIVCTPNVGNIKDHPGELLSPDLSAERFIETLQRALEMKKQLKYQTPTPEEATDQLLRRLTEIVQGFRHLTNETGTIHYRPRDFHPSVAATWPCFNKRFRSKFDKQQNVPASKIRVEVKNPSIPRSPNASAEDNIVQQLRSLLICPKCGNTPLNLQANLNQLKHSFICARCNFAVELNKGVAEFETDDRHVNSFTNEWDRHSRVQVDSHGYRCGYRGFIDSHDTFWKKTGLRPEDLSGQIVLDGGCGVGRFTEIAAEVARGVLAVDLSHAVYHAANLMAERNFHHALCLKANLEKLPLVDNCVDIAFTIGVAHHSPDPLQVLRELTRVTKRGGLVCGWLYAKHRSYGSPARDKVRAFTTNPANFEWVQKFSEMAPALRDLSLRGSWDELREVMGISSSTNDDECVLDTFDWLTPRYQYQYTADEIRQMLTSLGLTDIFMPPFPVSFKAKKA